MSNKKTVALLGVSDAKSIQIAKKIAETNAVLVFDADAMVLAKVYSQLLLENPKANLEMMDCPTNASWEADVIIFSCDAVANANLVEKIRNVATGKMILILGNQNSTITLENSSSDFQYLFPFSKVMQGIESTDQNKDTLIIKGNDIQALTTLATFFTSVGLKTNTQLPNTNS